MTLDINFKDILFQVLERNPHDDGLVLRFDKKENVAERKSQR